MHIEGRLAVMLGATREIQHVIGNLKGKAQIEAVGVEHVLRSEIDHTMYTLHIKSRNY